MSQTPADSPYRWRAADLEGIRVALSIPALAPGSGLFLQRRRAAASAAPEPDL